MADRLKPKLLIVELWGLGDLVIGTPFIRAASEKFDVTVLAKPYAADLQQRFWPGVTVFPFTAPWTAFKHKYQLWNWRWSDFYRLRKLLKGQFHVGLSARWDPRDHFLIALTRARQRIGFPRVGSRVLLTDALQRPDAIAHRSEYWRLIGQRLGLRVQRSPEYSAAGEMGRETVLIHSGAGQPVRVWPLPRYQGLVQHLRNRGLLVQVACDADQRGWWLQVGESSVATPKNVTELMALIDHAAVFIGNDSGPGHLAAVAGVPTFTLFGPQVSEWFIPMHPAAEALEGKACPYKPCSDYCRFESPLCIQGISEQEVIVRAEEFVKRHVRRPVHA